MRIETNNLISLIASFSCVALLLSVSLSRKQPHLKRALQTYLLGLILWSSMSVFVLSWGAVSPVWHRLLLSGIMLTILGSFHLVQVFLSNRRSWQIHVTTIGFAALVINTGTNFFINLAALETPGNPNAYASSILLIAVPGLGLVVFTLLDLFTNYKQADEPTQRNRLRYLMVGITLLLTGLLIHLQPFGRHSIDLLTGALSALIIVFALVKQHLVDIDVIVRRSILYTVPTTIIGALYFLVITIAFKLFDAASGLQLFLVSMLVAILTAIIAQPQHEKIKSWIDRLFFREKYDVTLMLQRISRTATSLLEVNMLSNMILDEISATFRIDTSAFLLKDKQSKEFNLVVHRNLGKNTNIRLRADHPIVIHLSKAEEAISRRDTNLWPQFKSLWEEEKAVLEKIGAELYIPLRSQGELIGILAIGSRRSHEPYSQDDKSSLTTLGNQVAVAIENARLYTTEQTRRKELDSLYTLSRRLIATDAMNTVLDNVVEHALESIHVTFTRILLKNDNGSFTCRAVHPVFGLEYELGLGKTDPQIIYRYFETVLESREPLVIDRHLLTLTPEARKALFLDQVHSLCLCPLRIGDEPIGILVMGERRNTHRESFDPEKLRLASAIADQASGAIRRVRLHEQLEESFLQTILALANAIDAKDNYTSDHGERLSKLATDIALRLKCTPQEIQAVNWGMRLHDIGKIGVPDEVLQKPGPLNDDEWRLMRRHPEIGANIVSPVKNLQTVAPIILHHHERFDGLGYPHKLSGENIPLGARIIAVVDTYGAITDNRVYRKARSHEEAIIEIDRCKGAQFDPNVTAAFKEAIKELLLNNRIPEPGHQEKRQALAAD